MVLAHVVVLTIGENSTLQVLSLSLVQRAWFFRSSPGEQDLWESDSVGGDSRRNQIKVEEGGEGS